MTTAPPNPRRAFKKGAAPTIFSTQFMSGKHATSHLTTDLDRSLRKSATFHSPKSPASEGDPILNIPLLSRRSPTSPSALRDILVSSEERVALLLGKVDQSLSGLESFHIDSQETIRPDEHPVPGFLLKKDKDDKDCMEIDPPHKQRPHHTRHLSDSGIGSSVSDSEDNQSRDDAAQMLADLRKSVPILNEVRSGINGAGTSSAEHALSAYACRQIQKYLILPILKEKTLKAFHPLVSGVPARVGRKEITCLRDLEKVLLYLSPRFSESRSAFIRFCETSIQCLHTTAEHLNDADQRRPADRPYTNSYFLDLTEQVRQYAAMISQARQRLAAGEAQPEDEETVNSTLSMEGGLADTGRPAQLVRTSNGHSISMLDGEEVDLDELREEARREGAVDLDDETLLSMARRKKNAPPRPLHRCGECDKEFKRPCDLTKHEKTHSRPWKCSDAGCKYHDYGWPTEKERDRHMNDKHSAAPAMFRCQFHPCPYESKRESNCKQHMEKAHGWAYVRSKNNGKKGRQPSGTKSTAKPTKIPPTPESSTPGSHIFDAGSDFGGSHGSSNTNTSPYMSMDAYTPSPFEPTFSYNHPDHNQTLAGPSHEPFTPISPFATPSTQPRLSIDDTNNAHNNTVDFGNDAPMPDTDFPLFNNTFDWANMDTDFTSMNIQLFTPATTIDDYLTHSREPSLSHTNNPGKLSPGAHGNMTLFTPQEQALDETFVDFSASVTEAGKQVADFALFDEASSNDMGGLFESLPPFQSQTWASGLVGGDSQMMDSA